MTRNVPSNTSAGMTPDSLFEGQPLSRQLFEAVLAAVDAMGDAEWRVTRSQVAFRRRRAFAWIWMPGRYLATAGNRKRRLAPLVLTIALRHQDPSLRWKEIVEPAPGRFTHHLELYTIDDVDDEVRGWLREAWVIAA